MSKFRSLAALLLSSLTACGQEAATEPNPVSAPPSLRSAQDAWPPPKVARDFHPNQVMRGETVYERNCRSCHGPRGKGQPGDWREKGPDGRYPPPPLDDTAHAWHHPTKILRQVIKHGSPGGSGNMPAWQDVLTDAQIDDVIVYIKSLWSDDVYAVWHDIERRSLEP